MNKYAKEDAGAEARRRLIASLVESETIGSQSELAERLRARGVQVTQATLSRDLKSLRIGKVPGGEGSFYRLPAPSRDLLDPRHHLFELEAFVREVKVVQNLILVLTPPGNAHGVGRALDLLGWAEVEGTIAGDDTILIVTASAARARKFRSRLAELIGRSLS